VATADEALSILTSLVAQLYARRRDVLRAREYYEGRHTLEMASPQYQAYFAERYEGFSDNWCPVVADAPVERLEVTGIRLAGTDTAEADQESDRDLWQDWLRQEADHTSDMAFVEASIGRRAFGLVWGVEEDEPTISFETPDQAIVAYDPETRDRVAGLKLWADGAWEYATLYLPDEIWKYMRRRATSTVEASPPGVAGLILPPRLSNWLPRELPGEPWPLGNPLGEVPLVEIQNRPRLSAEPLSDISGVIAMQNAINLFWAYLLNAGDYASFPQRVVMGAERPKQPVLDENGQVIGVRDVPLDKFSVDRLIWLEDPASKIGEWSAANLTLYTDVLEVMVGHIASQTRTPHHYLIGKMANLSAEALKAAETGLVKRTQEKTKSYGRGIREIFRLVALVRGQKDKADQVRSAQVVWRDVESRSEAQTVDAALKLRQIGYPLEYISKRIGMSPSEIIDVMDMIKRERESDPLNLLAGNGGQQRPAPDEEE
jgi:hypothetical protein